MRLSKTIAMLAGSFVVYVAVSCTSSKLDEVAKDAAVEDAITDALAELGVDSPEAQDAVAEALDAVRDALEEGGPTDAKADPPPISGTRLRARYTVTKSADGAVSKVFAGWYDTLRKEACTVQTAADGKKRCLPLAFTATDTRWYWEDAKCTKPVVRDIDACSAVAGTKYLARNDSALTCGGTRVYLLGAKVSVAMYYAPLFGSGAGSGCGAASVSSGPFDVIPITEVAPTEFAEVTISEEVD